MSLQATCYVNAVANRFEERARFRFTVLVKTKTPQIIRVKSQPADAHRKRRVIALLETAVIGIASNRYHPQPGMQCSWCQFKNECMAWLPEAYQERRAA